LRHGDALLRGGVHARPHQHRSLAAEEFLDQLLRSRAHDVHRREVAHEASYRSHEVHGRLNEEMTNSSETIQHPDGRVELRPEALAEISQSSFYNEDLAPVPVSRRNWTTYNYAALWISMAHCIPTYMLSSGLISAGMNWWQALFTILLGNTIVLIPILLNSHPGTKYGIPFPVFARAAYGTYGSNLPAMMRAIVACGWFGIQAWIGGEALNTLFAAIVPGWKTLLGGPIGGHLTTEWISFLLFW